MHDPQLLKWYKQNNLELPEHVSHDLSADDISSKAQSVNPRNWRQEGNRLIADTDFGPLVNHLPTDVIMSGLDSKGLPTFKKIAIT